MACYHPITAYRREGGPDPHTGKWPLTFNIDQGIGSEMKIPCGQCIGCRLERSRQWAIRCVHESRLYDDNCFLTLTYSPEGIQHLPWSIMPDTGEVLRSLNKRDICLFMKRLRKKFGADIRFFQCGEYGERYNRPHHHVLLFNHDFPDRDYCGNSNNIPLYKSKILEELWPYGLSAIGDVTFDSAAYCARYITKKINGLKSIDHYGGRLPEYITMSRRPGIGRAWYEMYKNDVYTQDLCDLGRGMILRPPKYYDNLYDLEEPDDFRRIKEKREEMVKLVDNTPERLAVREESQRRRALYLIRGYEKEN